MGEDICPRIARSPTLDDLANANPGNKVTAALGAVEPIEKEELSTKTMA